MLVAKVADEPEARRDTGVDVLYLFFSMQLVRLACVEGRLQMLGTSYMAPLGDTVSLPSNTGSTERYRLSA